MRRAWRGACATGQIENQDVAQLHSDARLGRALRCLDRLDFDRTQPLPEAGIARERAFAIERLEAASERQRANGEDKAQATEGGRRQPFHPPSSVLRYQATPPH